MQKRLILEGLGAIAGLVLFVAPAAASPALMLANANFLAGPGGSYDSLGQLDQGDRVDAIWCATKEGLCLVEIHNVKGWVPLADLNLKPGRKRNALDALGDTGGSSSSGPSGRSSKGTTATHADSLAETKSPGSPGPTFSTTPTFTYVGKP